VKRTALIVVVALAVAALPFGLRRFVVEAFKIPSGSMIPTLQVGDHLFVDKMATHPSRGDVVVYRYPLEPDKDFIKRVIAVGGDTVEWQGEVPVVNGRPIARRAVEGACSYDDYDENMRQWEARSCRQFEETLDGRSWRIVQEASPYPRSFPPLKVPANSYYMLGDNRDNSHDSRFYGPVGVEFMKGTATRIWFSAGKQARWERVNQKVR
jgi:signal peptidase I